MPKTQPAQRHPCSHLSRCCYLLVMCISYFTFLSSILLSSSYLPSLELCLQAPFELSLTWKQPNPWYRRPKTDLLEQRCIWWEADKDVLYQMSGFHAAFQQGRAENCSPFKSNNAIMCFLNALKIIRWEPANSVISSSAGEGCLKAQDGTFQGFSALAWVKQPETPTPPLRLVCEACIGQIATKVL